MFTISVIIPNYNNEKYLNKCLDSVLSQTYPISEIVVYDDCSTDQSRKILNKYESSYKNIHVIYGEKNVGVSKARDLAIKHVNGDYVCMLDADDFFFSKDKIKNEMEKVELTYRNTGEKVISFSQTIDVDEKGEQMKNPKHKNLSGNELFKIVTRAYSNYMPRDYCFPKEIYIKSGGYTEGLSLYEDWDLNMKLSQYTNFVYSGQFGTAYRHKNGGLSSVPYKKHIEIKKDIFKKYKSSISEKIVFYCILYYADVCHRVGLR